MNRFNGARFYKLSIFLLQKPHQAMHQRRPRPGDESYPLRILINFHGAIGWSRVPADAFLC
jgi:hypothetical protein